MIIKGHRVGPLLKATGREILDDNVLGLAAQTAYYFFFSLFPLLLFAAPVIGLIGDQERIVRWVMAQLATTVPPDAIEFLSGIVEEVVFAPGAPGLMSVGLVLAAWTGSNVFNALIDALNRAYDVAEGRPWWKKRLVALASVVISGLILAIVSTVMLAGPEIVRWVERTTPLGPAAAGAWMVLQYPVAFAFLVGMMYLIYYSLPNLRQDKRQVLVGAVAAAIVWVLVTLLFRAYVTNFGNYNKTYGTLGAVIVLLTWMYLTMLVILAGGELNAELHHGTGALQPRRGAVYAGRVITSHEPGRHSNDSVDRLLPLPRRGT